MELLPKWLVPGVQPAIYDVESKTILQQTAKLYQAMNDLIAEHNKRSEQLGISVNQFQIDMTDDFEVYATALRQEFQDFIDTITLAFESLEAKVQVIQDKMNEFEGVSVEALNEIKGGEY